MRVSDRYHLAVRIRCGGSPLAGGVPGVVTVFVLVAGCQGPPSASTRPEPVSSCRRISEPGRYYLTRAVEGAPVAPSTQPELDRWYTKRLVLERTCIEISASNVVLDCRGHTVSGPSNAKFATAGIYIGGTAQDPLTNVRLEHCEIKAHHFGIYSGFVHDSVLTQNEVRRCLQTGFYVVHALRLELSKNVAEGNDPDGILVLRSYEVVVRDNDAYYNRMRGITVDYCQQCEFRRNEAHHHGVAGFAVYESEDLLVEKNSAHDNQYHGFVTTHKASAATFRGNTSSKNDRTGFYFEGARAISFSDNLSQRNALDGVVGFRKAQFTAFKGNTLRANRGYGVFSDTTAGEFSAAANTFSNNLAGAIGSKSPEDINICRYTGFTGKGPCNPIFTGGKNPKDPRGE